MAIKIAGRLFTGPFPIETTRVRSNHSPVVYAVVGKGGESWDPAFWLVDVGESAGVDLAFAEHPRRASWDAQNGELGVYLFQMQGEHKGTDEERRAIVEEIRRQYAPPNDRISLR